MLEEAYHESRKTIDGETRSIAVKGRQTVGRVQEMEPLGLGHARWRPDSVHLAG